MKTRDYGPLLAELAEAYAHRSPKSKDLNERAKSVEVDGGSHALRLIDPFPPRIVPPARARPRRLRRDTEGHRRTVRHGSARGCGRVVPQIVSMPQRSAQNPSRDEEHEDVGQPHGPGRVDGAGMGRHHGHSRPV